MLILALSNGKIGLIPHTEPKNVALNKCMLILWGDQNNALSYWNEALAEWNYNTWFVLNHIGQISSILFCLETEVILTVWHILGFLLACMQDISSSCTIMIIYFLLDFHQIVAVHLSQSNIVLTSLLVQLIEASNSYIDRKWCM